jgi:hypothetical protein
MSQLFALRYNLSEIRTWANLYPVEDDKRVEKTIAPLVRKRHYFEKEEFVELCRWKTHRSRRLVQSNTEDFIKEVTHTALTTRSERLRIEVLTLLNGVSWPTASVLLHFGYDNLYPILDFRALWSLGVDATKVNYNFDFWWEYTQFCRNLSTAVGVSMRVLDRALWQYSDAKQGKRIL